jgi:hypothetical protein
MPLPNALAAHPCSTVDMETNRAGQGNNPPDRPHVSVAACCDLRRALPPPAPAGQGGAAKAEHS